MSTIALQIFKYSIFLIFTILIVNVQISGLKNAKPPLGGPKEGPGYKKFQKCDEKNFYYFYITKKSSVKMKLKRRVRREGEGVEGAVTRFRGQISHFL